jgi:hypothetical protein
LLLGAFYEVLGLQDGFGLCSTRTSSDVQTGCVRVRKENLFRCSKIHDHGTLELEFETLIQTIIKVAMVKILIGTGCSFI